MRNASGALSARLANERQLLMADLLTLTLANAVITEAPTPDDWFRSDSLGLVNGAAVTAWTNDADGTRDGSQSTGADQPIYTTGVQNGLPALNFNTALSTECIGFTSHDKPQATFFFAARFDALSDSRFGRLYSDGAYEIFLNESAGGPSDLVFQSKRATTTGVWTSTTGALTVGGAMGIIEVRYDSSSLSNVPVVLVNGTALTMTTTTAPVGAQNSGAGTALLGGRVGSGFSHYGWGGMIAECSTFASVLDTSDAGVERQRYASKYAIAVVGGVTLAPSTGVVRLTSADHTITIGANVFPVPGPTFTHGTIKTSVGLQTDTMTLTIVPDNAFDTLSGVTWPAAAANGVLDGARVTVERLILKNWTDDPTDSTFILFSGVVSQVQPSRNTVALTVSSDLELLTIPLPRNLWQPGCVHSLYDAGCTLVKGTAGLSRSGTLIAGSTTTTLLATDSGAQATGFFDLGSMIFTSGPNAGAEFTLKSFINGWTASFPGGILSVAGNTSTITTLPQLSANTQYSASYQLSLEVVLQNPGGCTVTAVIALESSVDGGVTWVSGSSLTYADTDVGGNRQDVAAIVLTNEIQTITLPGLLSPPQLRLRVVSLSATNGGSPFLGVIPGVASGTDGHLIFTPVRGLPYVPAPGDAWTAYAGCDKLASTCTHKFNNAIHYRGFPYVPVPLTMR